MAKHSSSNCNHPKEMYYSPWCPICDVPQVKTVTTQHINLLQTLRHLEVVHNRQGLKDRLNTYFRNFYEDDYGNGKSFCYAKEDVTGSDDLSLDLIILNNFLKMDSIYFDVSW